MPDEPIGTESGTEEPTSPPTEAPSGATSTTEAVDPQGQSTQQTADPDPTKQGTETDPAMVPSHVVSRTRRQLTEQFQGQLQQAQAQMQQQFQQEIARARAQERQEWEGKVRALMGLEQPADPAQAAKKQALVQQLQDLVPGLKHLSDDKPQPLEETDAYKQLTARLGAYERQQAENSYRFGVERRLELQRLAKDSLGKDLSKEQGAMLTMTLDGLLRNNPGAQQAFFNDPNFMQDFWKLWSGQFMAGVKADASAAQTHATKPAGPQSKPGGGNVQPTEGEKLTSQQKLARHYDELRKKYPNAQ